jgi:hypothetical protein
VATTVISGEINDASGSPLEDVQVTCVLRPRPAFETATGVELASILSTTTDSNGQYSFTLTRTADITPDESWYEVIERIPDRYGGPAKHIIQVGAIATSVYASRVGSSPPSSATETYLTQTAGDARYVLSPGSFGSAGALVEVTPGDSADAGVTNSYARIDHRHPAQQGFQTCTSSTRPASPVRGDVIYEIDTGKVLTYYGATTGWKPPWDARWGVMAYASASADQAMSPAAETDVTSLTSGAVTYVANRRIRIEWHEPGPSGGFGGDIFELRINKDGSAYHRAVFSIATSNLVNRIVTVVAYDSPSAGSHTYKATAIRTGGANTITFNRAALTPSLGFFVVEDIGPASATPPAS